jgi:hypothetical protein
LFTTVLARIARFATAFSAGFARGSAVTRAATCFTTIIAARAVIPPATGLAPFPGPVPVFLTRRTIPVRIAWCTITVFVARCTVTVFATRRAIAILFARPAVSALIPIVAGGPAIPVVASAARFAWGVGRAIGPRPPVARFRPILTATTTGGAFTLPLRRAGFAAPHDVLPVVVILFAAARTAVRDAIRGHADAYLALAESEYAAAAFVQDFDLDLVEFHPELAQRPVDGLLTGLGRNFH